MNGRVRETKTIRRPYCKLQLEEVRLVAEEAVLQVCKIVGGGVTSPNNANCQPASVCVNQGS